MPGEFVDPYVDPETGVLRNLVGARTYDDLARAGGACVPSDGRADRARRASLCGYAG